MIKSYRLIQQWNDWLVQALGVELLFAENKILSRLLQGYYANQVVLIGAAQQFPLMNHINQSSYFLITPLVGREHPARIIQSDWVELPLSSGSVDLVVLPHTLEHVDNARQVLSEACRILKPEGTIIIFGFNPYSLWSLQQGLNKKLLPAKQYKIAARSVKQWLKLEDFELLHHASFMFRPLMSQAEWFKQLKWIDWVGEKMHLPFGAVYVLMAKAKVVPLTPIRLHWKQVLAPVRNPLASRITRNY